MPGSLGGRFDRGQGRRQRRRERLDPVEVDGVGDPAAIVLAHLVLTPAVRHRNRDPRPGSSRPRSNPTLMYSSPVADSIERVRAVCTDAQHTISGKISPTIRRSQTNSAHGPTSEENGATSAGPAPVPTHHTNSTTWTTTDDQQGAGEQDQRRLGELGRDQVPVAQDHRREDPADGRADDRQLDEQREDAGVAIAPGEGAEQQRRDADKPPRPTRRPGRQCGSGAAGDQRRRDQDRRTGAGPRVAAYPRSG